MRKELVDGLGLEMDCNLWNFYGWFRFRFRFEVWLDWVRRRFG